MHRSVRPGTTMEVDFGESWVDIAGAPCKVKYLVATLPFSNAYFAKAYPVERIESLLDGIEPVRRGEAPRPVAPRPVARPHGAAEPVRRPRSPRPQARAGPRRPRPGKPPAGGPKGGSDRSRSPPPPPSASAITPSWSTREDATLAASTLGFVMFGCPQDYSEVAGRIVSIAAIRRAMSVKRSTSWGVSARSRTSRSRYDSHFLSTR